MVVVNFMIAEERVMTMSEKIKLKYRNTWEVVKVIEENKQGGELQVDFIHDKRPCNAENTINMVQVPQCHDGNQSIYNLIVS